jgi:hypothetical protein
MSDVVRWERVQQVFQAALDRPPSERSAFVSVVCGSDDDLRAEVASLLDADERARIANGEVVVRRVLRIHAGSLRCGPESVGVERLDTNAEVIDAPWLVALLQDDQPACRQVESVIVRSLDDPRWSESEQPSIEGFRSRHVRHLF